jgi:hypothetical protein
MSIYSKPVWQLLGDFADEFLRSPVDQATIKQAVIWFEENYPRIKKGTIDLHIRKMSVNLEMRLNWTPRYHHNVFWFLGDGTFRRYDPETDGPPIMPGDDDSPAKSTPRPAPAPASPAPLPNPPPRSSGLVRIDQVLDRLSKTRTVFYNEADFQHAFALVMREEGATKVRLEQRFDSLGGYLDLHALFEGRLVGVELKYWTRLLNVEVAGESFALKQQGANPLSRYDFIKDIDRLEALIRASDAEVGYAIALTNDPMYWNPGRSGSMDDAFRLNEGAVLEGKLDWKPGTTPSTIKGRETAFDLKGCYPMAWRPYSVVAPKAGEFRYLAVEV